MDKKMTKRFIVKLKQDSWEDGTPYWWGYVKFGFMSLQVTLKQSANPEDEDGTFNLFFKQAPDSDEKGK